MNNICLFTQKKQEEVFVYSVCLCEGRNENSKIGELFNT